MKTLNLNYLSLSIGAIAALLAPVTALATAGDIYETDGGSGTIFKFTPAGTKTTFASGLSMPAGLAFDGSGNLFESDIGSSNIYKFTSGGTKTTFASGLSTPAGMAFDVLGNLFEADAGSGNIYKFKPDGTRTTFAAGLNGPAIVAFDQLGDGSARRHAVQPGERGHQEISRCVERDTARSARAVAHKPCARPARAVSWGCKQSDAIDLVQLRKESRL